MESFSWVGDMIFGSSLGLLKAVTEGAVAGVACQALGSDQEIPAPGVLRYIPGVVHNVINRVITLSPTTDDTSYKVSTAAAYGAVFNAYLLDLFWGVILGQPPSNQQHSYVSFVGSTAGAFFSGSLIAPMIVGQPNGDFHKALAIGRTGGNMLWRAFPEAIDEIF